MVGSNGWSVTLDKIKTNKYIVSDLMMETQVTATNEDSISNLYQLMPPSGSIFRSVSGDA